MLFNPLTFDSTSTNKGYDVVQTNNSHDCLYMTPEQFSSDRKYTQGKIEPHECKY